MSLIYIIIMSVVVIVGWLWFIGLFRNSGAKEFFDDMFKMDERGNDEK